MENKRHWLTKAWNGLIGLSIIGVIMLAAYDCSHIAKHYLNGHCECEEVR